MTEDPLREMEIIFQADLIRLFKDDSEMKIELSHRGYLEKWRNGRLGLGGLLGETEVSKMKDLV